VVVIDFSVLHHGDGFKTFGFVNVGFFNVVTFFLRELVACPEVLGGAEIILFTNAAADGVVAVFGGLVVFADFVELVIKIVFKLCCASKLLAGSKRKFSLRSPSVCLSPVFPSIDVTNFFQCFL